MKTKSIVFKAGAKKVMDGVTTKLKKHEMGGEHCEFNIPGYSHFEKNKKRI